MPRSRETADLARRDVLQVGLAGASALVLGASPRSRAGDTPGTEHKELTAVDATAPPQVDRWAEEVEPRVIGWRRHIHQRPELSYEDFGAFSSVVPGLFWYLRASPFADRRGAPNHSPYFAIDEKYLTTGVKALLHVSLAYLHGQAPP